MIKTFIIFLIRRRLGLKKYENFQFDNQKNKEEWYYFAERTILKICDNGMVKTSDVSLTWLLDDRCKIIKKEV